MIEASAHGQAIVETMRSAGEISDSRLFHCLIFNAQVYGGVSSHYNFNVNGSEKFIPVSGELSFDLWAWERAGVFMDRWEGALPFKVGPNFAKAAAPKESGSTVNPAVLQKLVELMKEGRLVGFTKYTALRSLLPEATEAEVYDKAKNVMMLTDEEIAELDKIHTSLKDLVGTRP